MSFQAVVASWMQSAKTYWHRFAQTPDKSVDEAEFLPAALEIVETPASPAGRATALIIMIFFSIALLWASIGTVDIIATAPGKIIPTGRTKIIQPLEAGVVRAIHVRDGQRVKEGEVLVEIDSTITEAERNRLRQQYIDAELDAARLKAALEIDGDPDSAFNPPQEASAQQIETQRTLLLNQVREIKAKLSGLDQQIAQQQGNRNAVNSTIQKLNESIPYLQKRADARQSLSKRGYGSKLDALTAQQDLVEHQQDVQVQRGRLAEAEGALASLQQQRQEAEADYKYTTSQDLSDAQEKAATLHEQFVQAEQKYRLQTLTAPVDGTVQQLAIHTDGGVVTPAQVLMSIVPADSHLEIEALVSNQDIGFVHAGQQAAIKVDTFNFTRYGLLQGQVMSVSQDAILRDKPQGPAPDNAPAGAETTSSEPKGQELLYSAVISLDQIEMDVDGRMVSLAPGMAVTAEIKTGSRSVIAYLLSPIKRHATQALHER